MKLGMIAIVRRMTLLSVECVESVGSYGIRGRRPEEAQTGADLTHLCFTKDYAIPAMSIEDESLYDGRASATIRP